MCSHLWNVPVATRCEIFGYACSMKSVEWYVPKSGKRYVVGNQGRGTSEVLGRAFEVRVSAF